jgi:hypothetical protein
VIGESQLAAKVRIEERELEAGKLNQRTTKPARLPSGGYWQTTVGASTLSDVTSPFAFIVVCMMIGLVWLF